jgi:hypothetical protein
MQSACRSVLVALWVLSSQVQVMPVTVSSGSLLNQKILCHKYVRTLNQRAVVSCFKKQ